MPTVVSDDIREAALTLLSRLYDLEQSSAAVSAHSQDGAVDRAILQGYYIDVVRALRRAEGLGPAEGDAVTQAVLNLARTCLSHADEAHRLNTGGANVFA